MCKCAGCVGEAVPGADCKYHGTDDRARHLLHVWSLYVEEGNTSLVDLPLWVAEVGAMVRDYRSRRELKELVDTEEKKKARELLKAHGLVR